MFLKLGAKSQELPTNFLTNGGSIRPTKANRPMGACVIMKGRRFISDQFRPFLCRVGNCAELSAQRAHRWGWGGGIGTVWKGPQQITRPTLDGDREPGWDVWQPVPSRPVSFCHVPGEVLPSIDYPHCKKILFYIRTEPLLVRPVPIAPCLLVFSTRLMAALQVQEPCTEPPLGLLLTGRPDPAPWC